MAMTNGNTMHPVTMIPIAQGGSVLPFDLSSWCERDSVALTEKFIGLVMWPCVLIIVHLIGCCSVDGIGFVWLLS